MQKATEDSTEKYSLSEKEVYEIEEAFGNIMDLFYVINGYCEHNIEDKKICPLLTILEQIQSQSKIISDKF